MISQVLVLFLFAAGSASHLCTKNNNDLKILHVVFRHSDRTAVPFTYPNDPYKNVSLGFEQLTQIGKHNAFELGKLLKCRYQKILSRRPYYEMLHTLSSETQRTMQTLLGVLSGMFPPRKNESISPSIPWQPIAYNYIPSNEDKILGVHMSCPKVSLKVDIFDSLDAETQKIFREIGTKTGVQYVSYTEMLNLYDYMLVMHDLGYEIPAWALPYWPQPMTTFSNRGWHDFFDNRRNFLIGNLINKIAQDSMQPLANTDRRVYLYSGHANAGAIVDALGGFGDQHFNYNTYVAFEVTEVYGKRFVMAYYDNHDDDTPKYLEIPGCGFKCPVADFLVFAKKFLPDEPWCS